MAQNINEDGKVADLAAHRQAKGGRKAKAKTPEAAAEALQPDEGDEERSPEALAATS